MLQKFLFFSIIFNFSQAQKIFPPQSQNFSLLRDLTCAVAADEFAKHPEMRSILLVEQKNDFPKTFSAEILKCLPREVNKVILRPLRLVLDKLIEIQGKQWVTKFHFDHLLRKIPKESLVILVSDEVEKVRVHLIFQTVS